MNEFQIEEWIGRKENILDWCPGWAPKFIKEARTTLVYSQIAHRARDVPAHNIHEHKEIYNSVRSQTGMQILGFSGLWTRELPHIPNSQAHSSSNVSLAEK